MNKLVNYMVEWRHITMNDMMTPVMYLPREITQISAKTNATQWDIMMAISKEFDWISPDHVRVERYTQID